jgi:RNA polymerase sigma-70 factor (ECF subfamily)
MAHDASPDDCKADVAAVLAGDRDRFRALVVRFERPVFALIRSFVSDAGRVEDLAQETFLAAFTHLASFDARRGRFSTWLFAIARNKCRDTLRRFDLPVHPPIDRPERGASPAGSDSWVRAALDTLSPEQRMAFVLGEVFGLPYEEIAEIEGVAVGTVKSRASRAREQLRLVLEPQEETR